MGCAVENWPDVYCQTAFFMLLDFVCRLLDDCVKKQDILLF